jgi:hypothetical protein
MLTAHRRWWEGYLRQPSEQKSIAPVLGLTMLAMFATPLLNDFDWGRTVDVALVGASAVVALIRTGAHNGLRRAAQLVVGSATVAAMIAPHVGTGEHVHFQQVSAGLFVLLLMITPVVIMMRLLLRPRVTFDTLAGALTAYLQIGIFFGALYRFIDLIDTGHQFFAQVAHPAPMEFQYFSFITMTTVGYGDFTPATPLGQTLATLEAIVGQVFLVTVVALTVSNLGRVLPHRHALDAEGSADGDPDTGSDGPDDPPQAEAR